MLTLVNRNSNTGLEVYKRHYNGKTFEYMVKNIYSHKVVARFACKWEADAYINAEATAMPVYAFAGGKPVRMVA